MNRLTLAQAAALTPSKLAALSSQDLFHLQTEANEALTAAKAVAEHIDRALEFKFADHAHTMRRLAGKDTGVVHFCDGQIRITADLPKKVEWHQSKLADLAKRIADAGDDPKQYVEISYRVTETKYNAWPEAMRAQFVAARTMKTGKPGFRLALLDAEGAQ